MQMQRRRATNQELQQGMEEMKKAQERLEKEAKESQELPLEDAKGEETVGQESKEERLRLEDAPKERSSPAQIESRSDRASQDHPKTSPTAITPARPGSTASAPGQANPGDSQPGTVRTPATIEGRRKEEANRRSVGETGGGRESGVWTAVQTPHSHPVGSPEVFQPLFTEEQVKQMELLHSRAPWLYQEAPRTFFPRRPSFLEQEEARMTSESTELATLRSYMKELIDRNEELTKRVQMLEAGIVKPEVELSFSTPNGSHQFEESKEAVRPPEAPKEAVRPPEAPKEAVRPPEAPKEAVRSPKEKQSNVEDSGETPLPGSSSSSKPDLHAAQGATGFAEKSMEFMSLMMENMKEMHRKLHEDKEESGTIRGVEVVRSGTHELPQLPAWSSTQAPLQLSDWLLLVAPVISDLSATAETWWKTMVAEAEQWYQSHMLLSPLERLQHGSEQPAALMQEKWQRLERRVATMMLQSIPEQVREELVSSRKLTVFAIVTHLYVTYCPGGITEKQNLLKNLEEPTEVANVSEAPSALRRWLRWRQRATEIGATMPDPTLLVRGLLRMTRKVLEANRELQFRVSLARHGLGIDTVPTLESVTQFAMHLLSECEQISQMEKKPMTPAPKGEIKLKAVETEKEDAAKGKGKGKDRSPEEEKTEKPRAKCRFFLTTEGCRKGKECRFSHSEKDGKRRCYTCGSTEHMAPDCPRKSSSESPPKQKMVKAESESGQGSKSAEDPSSETETMKGLIEEANKMLRSLTAKSGSPSCTSSTVPAKEEENRSEVLSRLQAQLNSLKVFKLGRITRDLTRGLIDSGATHPFRPLRSEEAETNMKSVEVTLADGRCVQLKMTTSGSMVTDDEEVEPIVPMGMLIQVLGCEVKWSKDGLQVHHPRHGPLKVESHGGCPQISRKLALELISEIEDAKEGVSISRLGFEGEVEWMKRLIAVHPVLSQLPEWLKSQLVVEPSDWNLLPVNRRRRRTLRQGGFALHLFSGDEEGYTLKRSIKGQGGPHQRLLEIDIKHGPSHDLLKGNGPYAALLRAAVEGKILSVIGGPNCRSRSVLRHRPIPGQPDAPRPIRSWDGGEFGAPWITSKEAAMLREDDVLMWRMLFLFMVAEYTRRAQMKADPVHLVLEQPASPRSYEPEAVSFWDTKEWKGIRDEFKLNEVTFNQGNLGGLAPKPTTLGTTFDLCMEDYERPLQRDQEVKSSKQLERWAPGLMDAVGAATVKEVFKQTPQLKALTFEEHVAFGHVPYRRDCAVCQRASQQNFPHRKVKHPQAGVLALDTCGPLFPASDVGGWKCRYFLAGSYTYMVPKGSTKMEAPQEEEGGLEEAPALEALEDDGGECRGVAEEWQQPERLPPNAVGMVRGDQPSPRRPPPAEAEELAQDQKEEEHSDGGECRGVAEEWQQPERLPPSVVGMVRGDQLSPRRPPPADAEEPVEAQKEEEKGDGPEEPDPKEELEMRVFKMALPMRSKKAKEVTRAAMEMILKLKMDGYQVSRIHSDRGHEFLGSFETWMKARGILLTRTSGDDPRANGRAEATVKSVKNQLRRILMHAGVGSQWWPWALRYLNEVYRCQRLDKVPDFPLFLQDVLVRRRRWKKQAFEPTVEVSKYLGPAPEENGHWIKAGDEAPRVTRCFMRKALERPDEGVWLAVEREVLDALTKRRRLREKTTVRRLQMEEPEKDEEEEAAKVAKMRMQFTKVVEEEMKMMLEDDQELITEEIEILASLKKILNSQEVNEDDEILQTKIISLQEVSKKWQEWLPAIDAEVSSLLEEKEAMEEVSGEKLETLLKEAEEKGMQVEFLPSKLVCTKKPGKKGGRNKIRWVICGNFEQVKEGENTFSSGADASALRLLVVTASKHQWAAGTIDIKTAFLNASMDPQDQPSLLLVKPPPLLLEKRYMKAGTYYLPKRAVYGLRRSPRLWGDCRDEGLHHMKVHVQEGERDLTLRLVPLDSEPNLWRIEEEGQDSETVPVMKGLLMTYVDDIFVTGSDDVVEAVMTSIRKLWTTSEPDQVGVKPIRFLGVEISKVFDQEKGRDIWYIGQQSYIKELLAQDEDEVLERKIPITKDQSQFVEEEKKTPDLIKAAQKATGEMLWLVTRTRADLMYAVSRMGSNVTKAPQKVLQIYQQIKGYLKKTWKLGLRFDAAGQDPVMIEAFSDASFAPEGEVSHGAFLVKVAGCLVFWRSGRQSFITLSTAEAEMMEIMESMVAGESIGAIADELYGELHRKSWTDSQAALSILSSDGGSWRTRHLRLRASAARQSINQGNWSIQHQPGNKMTADIGTKPLSSERIKVLREEMNMFEVPGTEKEEEEKNMDESVPRLREGAGADLEKTAGADLEKTAGADLEKTAGADLEKTAGADLEKTAVALKLLTLAAVLSVAKGEEEEEPGQNGMAEFHIMMAVFTVMVIGATLAIQCLWKAWKERLGAGVRRHTGSATQGLAAERKGKGKGGESRGVAEEWQQPERLPPSAVGMVRGDQTSPRRPPPSTEGQGVTLPQSPSRFEEPSSESSEERPYRPLDERHIPEVNIEGELLRIAEEEAILYDEAQRDPDRFYNYERSDEDSQPLFQVLTTRFGGVYHFRSDCHYLSSPQTGSHRESGWCWMCRAISLQTRGRPPPGVPLWIDHWGGSYHVDDRCPRRHSQRAVRACQACQDLNAGQPN